jgi:hypothetical protein
MFQRLQVAFSSRETSQASVALKTYTHLMLLLLLLLLLMHKSDDKAKICLELIQL